MNKSGMNNKEEKVIGSKKHSGYPSRSATTKSIVKTVFLNKKTE